MTSSPNTLLVCFHAPLQEGTASGLKLLSRESWNQSLNSLIDAVREGNISFPLQCTVLEGCSSTVHFDTIKELLAAYRSRPMKEDECDNLIEWLGGEEDVEIGLFIDPADFSKRLNPMDPRCRLE